MLCYVSCARGCGSRRACYVMLCCVVCHVFEAVRADGHVAARAAHPPRRVGRHVCVDERRAQSIRHLRHTYVQSCRQCALSTERCGEVHEPLRAVCVGSLGRSRVRPVSTHSAAPSVRIVCAHASEECAYAVESAGTVCEPWLVGHVWTIATAFGLGLGSGLVLWSVGHVLTSAGRLPRCRFGRGRIHRVKLCGGGGACGTLRETM
jgi:hypothetical protein